MTPRQSSAKLPLSKDEVQSRLALSWARTIAACGGKKGAFADQLGVHVDTVNNALAGHSVPELHTVLNSLLACPNALDEVMKLYHLRLVPMEGFMSPDMETIFEMSRAITSFIQALDDGKRDHQETIELAKLLRPVVPKLTAIIHQADGLRSAA